MVAASDVNSVSRMGAVHTRRGSYIVFPSKKKHGEGDPMTRTGIGRLAAVVLTACFTAQHAHAQVLKAQILGTATDQTGAVVPGAKITITEINTNFTRTTLTNESG